MLDRLKPPIGRWRRQTSAVIGERMAQSMAADVVMRMFCLAVGNSAQVQVRQLGSIPSLVFELGCSSGFDLLGLNFGVAFGVLGWGFVWTFLGGCCSRSCGVGMDGIVNVFFWFYLFFVFVFCFCY